MLPKNHRLRHDRDFARLSKQGRPFYGPFCILRIRKSDSDPSKIGFVASGKIFKTAVARNRARRRMSEIIRLHADSIPSGFDMSFIAKPEVLKADVVELEACMAGLLRQAKSTLRRPAI